MQTQAIASIAVLFIKHCLIQGVSKVRSDSKLYLRKAFNASLGKCKLFQVRNLSK